MFQLVQVKQAIYRIYTVDTASSEDISHCYIISTNGIQYAWVQIHILPFEFYDGKHFTSSLLEKRSHFCPSPLPHTFKIFL